MRVLLKVRFEQIHRKDFYEWLLTMTWRWMGGNWRCEIVYCDADWGVSKGQSSVVLAWRVWCWPYQLPSTLISVTTKKRRKLSVWNIFFLLSSWRMGLQLTDSRFDHVVFMLFDILPKNFHRPLYRIIIMAILSLRTLLKKERSIFSVGCQTIRKRRHDLPSIRYWKPSKHKE